MTASSAPAIVSADYARACITAFLISLLLTPLVRRIALRLKVVQQPDPQRHSRRVVPLLGGVAIFCGFLFPILGWIRLDARMQPLLVGAALMFSVGLLDDLWPLNPLAKLIGQTVSACVAVLGATPNLSSWDHWLSALLTIFWIVAMVNALNLIDNIDGLAAGAAAICAGFISVLAIQTSSSLMLLLVACLGGASLGFLAHNFHPARIFMGDSGSLLLGYVLAVAITCQRSGGQVHGSRIWLVAPLLLGFPLMDTCFVVFGRLSRGQKFWQGAHDHLSHRLVAVGLTERSAVLVLYAVAAALSSCALLLIYSGRG